MIEIILIGITGAITGLSSGMFGIGGSAVATPLLILFVDMPYLIALATPLPAAIPSAISGSFMYHSKKLINYKLAYRILLFSIPSNFIGTNLTVFFDADFLINLKAFLLLLLGLKLILAPFILKSGKNEPNSSFKIAAITGTLAGLISGFIAIGGGIVMVTMFLRVHNLKIKSAIATSLFCVGFLALIGSIGHFYLGNIDVKSTIILAISVIPFAFLGAKLSTFLNDKVLEKTFGIFVMIFAIYFMFFKNI
jgi:uncharacterized membrane protein YfcA